MVKKMLYYRKRGWHIYTDLDINIPGVRKINIDYLNEYWPEENSVIFLDEIGLTMSNREWASLDKRKIEFLKLQRKCRTILFVNSQALDSDKKLRDLIDKIYWIKNIGFFSLVRPVYRDNFFTKATEDQDSRYADTFKTSSIFSWRLVALPRYFKYFNSWDKPYRPYMPYTIVPSFSEILCAEVQKGFEQLENRKDPFPIITLT